MTSTRKRFILLIAALGLSLMFAAYAWFGMTPHYLSDAAYIDIAAKHLVDNGETIEGLNPLVSRDDGRVFVSFYRSNVIGEGFIVRLTPAGDVEIYGFNY